MILAYIVNESESEILAESNVGVSTPVKLLQKAVESDDHRAQMNPDSDFVAMQASCRVVKSFGNQWWQ